MSIKLRSEIAGKKNRVPDKKSRREKKAGSPKRNFNEQADQ
jgi:hypothetical protein